MVDANKGKKSDGDRSDKLYSIPQEDFCNYTSLDDNNWISPTSRQSVGMMIPCESVASAANSSDSLMSFMEPMELSKEDLFDFRFDPDESGENSAAPNTSSDDPAGLCSTFLPPLITDFSPDDLDPSYPVTPHTPANTPHSTPAQTPASSNPSSPGSSKGGGGGGGYWSSESTSGRPWLQGRRDGAGGGGGVNASGGKIKIPRHKRESHINAEHRRRSKIQNGFDMVKQLVPTIAESMVSGQKESKTDLLKKTYDHCWQLQRDNRELERESKKLREQTNLLSADICNLQNFLPDHGLQFPRPRQPADLAQMFDDYVRVNTASDWKFAIFAKLIRPLFDSYVVRVTGPSSSTAPEFTEGLEQWLSKDCGLISLRRHTTEVLKQLSVQTNILSSVESYQKDVVATLTFRGSEVGEIKPKVTTFDPQLQPRGPVSSLALGRPVSGLSIPLFSPDGSISISGLFLVPPSTQGIIGGGGVGGGIGGGGGGLGVVGGMGRVEGLGTVGGVGGGGGVGLGGRKEGSGLLEVVGGGMKGGGGLGVGEGGIGGGGGLGAEWIVGEFGGRKGGLGGVGGIGGRMGDGGFVVVGGGMGGRLGLGEGIGVGAGLGVVMGGAGGFGVERRMVEGGGLSEGIGGTKERGRELCIGGGFGEGGRRLGGSDEIFKAPYQPGSASAISTSRGVIEPGIMPSPSAVRQGRKRSSAVSPVLPEANNSCVGLSFVPSRISFSPPSSSSFADLAFRNEIDSAEGTLLLRAANEKSVHQRNKRKGSPSSPDSTTETESYYGGTLTTSPALVLARAASSVPTLASFPQGGTVMPPQDSEIRNEAFPMSKTVPNFFPQSTSANALSSGEIRPFPEPFRLPAVAEYRQEVNDSRVQLSESTALQSRDNGSIPTESNGDTFDDYLAAEELDAILHSILLQDFVRDS